MFDDRSNLGLLNNSFVGLAILFTIPALLVVGGFFFIALSGRPAGGVDAQCEQFITDDLGFRIRTYTYTAGLTAYQQQGIDATTDGGNDWQPIFDSAVQAPAMGPCLDAIAIEQLDTAAWLVWNRKNVALSVDGGESWRTHQICDDPLPAMGRCDADERDFIAVEFSSPQQGVLTVERVVVDEYGQRVTQGGELILAEAYQLQTADGAQTWVINGLE